MKNVHVDLAERSYDIHIGEGLLARSGAFLAEAVAPTQAMIITDEKVGELYEAPARQSIEEAGISCLAATIPVGESSKSLEMASTLYDNCLDARLDRRAVIVALGGGVVGDLAGFVAATYMRGVPYVQIPTTLLADVDSSVGGKVAVNHARGKNMIGAFYQPRLVIADIRTLATLCDEDFAAGMVEVIKYGVIEDREFFGYLEMHRDALLERNPDALTYVIERCCRIKADVVHEDERESGRRAILNFGHTIGHAFERLTDYRDYRHGEAVAVGMVAACMLSAIVEGLPDDETARVRDLLTAFNAPTSVTGLAVDAVLEAMRLDKKAIGGRLRFVVSPAIGATRVRGDVPEEAVVRVLREIGCE